MGIQIAPFSSVGSRRSGNKGDRWHGEFAKTILVIVVQILDYTVRGQHVTVYLRDMTFHGFCIRLIHEENLTQISL